MTLALPKKGLTKNENVGKLFLVNIGIPRELYERDMGFKVGNYFEKSDVIEVK